MGRGGDAGHAQQIPVAQGNGRAAQQGQPREAIEAIEQHGAQGLQIADRGAPVQRREFPGGKGNAAPAQLADHRFEMPPRAAQHCDAAKLRIGHAGLDLAAQRRGLLLAAALARIEPDVRRRAVGHGRLRRGEHHGPELRIVARGKRRGKSLVDPVEDRCGAAEVHREGQRFKGQIADAAIAGAHKQADLGLAKAVNGLHGIADQKQGALAARAGDVVFGPAAHDAADQFKL